MKKTIVLTLILLAALATPGANASNPQNPYHSFIACQTSYPGSSGGTVQPSSVCVQSPQMRPAAYFKASKNTSCLSNLGGEVCGTSLRVCITEYIKVGNRGYPLTECSEKQFVPEGQTLVTPLYRHVGHYKVSYFVRGKFVSTARMLVTRCN